MFQCIWALLDSHAWSAFCLLFNIKLLTTIGFTDFDGVLGLFGLVLSVVGVVQIAGARMGEGWSSMEQEKKFATVDNGVLVAIP